MAKSCGQRSTDGCACRTGVLLTLTSRRDHFAPSLLWSTDLPSAADPVQCMVLYGLIKVQRAAA
jgi:hypothetical protein